MIDQTAHQASRQNSAQEDEFQLLRKLLLLPEQERLKQMETWAEESEVNATSLGRMLPEAVRIASKDEALAESLGPTLSNAFAQSVKDDPQSLADAVAPIMGPAIRQSIQQAIRSMVQSLNQAMDQSLSAKGLGWRIESWRTGRPFGEVVMLHSLKYRVEEVFLIHRETSLLLQHATAEELKNSDADVVSSMLGAIQDFVRDSFGAGDGETLQTMQVGDKTVWVQQGSQAMIAATIQGNAPESLRVDLTKTLERIHIERSHALNDFQGDIADFETIKPVLDNCLKSELKQTDEVPSKKSSWPLAILAAGLLGMIGAGCWWGWNAHRHRQVTKTIAPPESVELSFNGKTVTLEGTASRKWLEAARERTGSLGVPVTWGVTDLDKGWFESLQRLREEPGIVIIESRIDAGTYFVEGMRDPLSTPPQEILDDHDLRFPVRQTWNPVMSTEPSLVMERFRRATKCPESVSMHLNGGQLNLAGSAPQEWIDRISTAPLMLSLDQINLSQVKASDSNSLAFIDAMKAEPGYVMAESRLADGKIILRGLRDPLAAEVQTVAAEFELDPDKVVGEWEEYESADPKIALLRAHQVLDPPETVQIDVGDDQVIRVAGSASRDWIQNAKSKHIAGIKSLDFAVEDADTQKWNTLIEEIEASHIEFAIGATDLTFQQDATLKKTADLLDQLSQTGLRLGSTWSLQIRGHSSNWTFDSNQSQSSLRRAKSVENRLAKLMSSTCQVDAVGVSGEDLGSQSKPTTSSGEKVTLHIKTQARATK